MYCKVHTLHYLQYYLLGRHLTDLLIAIGICAVVIYFLLVVGDSETEFWESTKHKISKATCFLDIFGRFLYSTTPIRSFPV